MAKMVKKYPELKALKGVIREKSSSYRELAEKMNMSPTTLSNKINGYSAFNTEEVDKIVSILKINPEDVLAIFFTNTLRFVTNGKKELP